MNTTPAQDKTPAVTAGLKPDSLNSELTTPAQCGRRLRLLVAIASFGEKNLEFLKSAIRTYHSMALDADVIVVSTAPKELGPRVRVVVGLPSENPCSRGPSSFGALETPITSAS